MINFLLILIYIFTLFLLAIAFKKFNKDNKELLRKIIHIGIGPLIPYAKFLGVGQNEALVFTGIIFIIGLNKFQIPESLVFILVTSLLLSISIIDYKHFIIPYQISISILLILMPYVIFYSNTSYHIYGMIIGLSYLLLIFILTWLITKKQAIGYGDIQLIILLGLWLGPLKILITIFLSACIGILYWGLLSIINGYTKHKKLPFGTFLSISSIIVYLIKLNWDLFR